MYYGITNTQRHNLKRGILKFSKKFQKTFLDLNLNLYPRCLFGILSSQSCMLSEISRKLYGNL